MRIAASILLLVFCASPAFGNVRRVAISKSSQSNSPIEFSVAGTPDQYGYVSVKLILPPEQEELAHLWKIDLWVHQDGKNVLSIPFEPDFAEDNTITARFRGHVDFVDQCFIAIRCGEIAPVSETIYQIDVGSYIDVESDHSPPESEGKPEFIFDSSPPSGIPGEATSRPEGPENHGSLHQLLGDALETVYVRHFSDAWDGEQEVREYLSSLFASPTTEAYTFEVWSQGAGVPEIECYLDFKDPPEGRVRDWEGKLLIWETVACFRDADGEWWYLSVYDHFHRHHPLGNRDLAPGSSDDMPPGGTQ